MGSALVVRNTLVHKRTGVAMVCPITNSDWNSFDVGFPDSSSLAGFIMIEQAKSSDYVSRRAKKAIFAPRPNHRAAGAS